MVAKVALKYIVFDFDGTLVQTRELAIRLFNFFADKYGYRKMEDGDMEYLASLPIKKRLRRLGCPLYKLPLLLVDVKKKYKQDVIGLRMDPEIGDMLIRLKQTGLKIGILSSNTEENITFWLDNHQVDVFDFICTGGNLFGKHKAIKNILKRFGIQKDEMLYVGDEVRDAEACLKVGVPFIAVSWGFDSAELLLKGKPAAVAHQPSELDEIIERLRRHPG